jgi:hypothetical protein
MVNICLNRIAARQKQPTVPLLDQVEDEHRTDLAGQHDAYAAADARYDLAALLARLPDEQRLAIVLVDVEGYSVAEAADALGLAQGHQRYSSRPSSSTGRAGEKYSSHPVMPLGGQAAACEAQPEPRLSRHSCSVHGTS